MQLLWVLKVRLLLLYPNSVFISRSDKLPLCMSYKPDLDRVDDMGILQKQLELEIYTLHLAPTRKGKKWWHLSFLSVGGLPSSVTHISAEKRGKISAWHLWIETFLTPFLRHENYCFWSNLKTWVDNWHSSK